MKYENMEKILSEEEINESVNLIITKGLAHKPLFEYKKISLRNLIFGVEDCVLIAFTLYTGFMIIFSIMSSKGTPFIPLQFLLSPLLFAVMMYLSMWKDIMNKTLEWKQACRFSYKYLTIYRMVLFGGSSMLCNVVYNILIWKITGGYYSFLWIMSFSFASLFLYGFISLSLMNRNVIYGIPALSFIWILIGMAMFLYEDVMRLTVIIPIYAILVILITAVIGLIYQIKAYLLSPMKGDALHAYN